MTRDQRIEFWLDWYNSNLEGHSVANYLNTYCSENGVKRENLVHEFLSTMSEYSVDITIPINFFKSGNYLPNLKHLEYKRIGLTATLLFHLYPTPDNKQALLALTNSLKSKFQYNREHSVKLNLFLYRAYLSIKEEKRFYVDDISRPPETEKSGLTVEERLEAMNKILDIIGDSVIDNEEDICAMYMAYIFSYVFSNFWKGIRSFGVGKRYNNERPFVVQYTTCEQFNLLAPMNPRMKLSSNYILPTCRRFNQSIHYLYERACASSNKRALIIIRALLEYVNKIYDDLNVNLDGNALGPINNHLKLYKINDLENI